ncbi:hypothetical protein [Nocardioides sp. SYSU D00038]|uniref:hypothetical protein n=1 Tax=Nocardioides sp. SYSU D00038 TaxID=2812554 RepID=UPI001967AFBA|nr:hypothetical protein [Nocardioides sp. SYSU D00038]
MTTLDGAGAAACARTALPHLLVALGSGLLAGGAVLTIAYSRARPDLDTSNVVVAVAATLVLLGTALLAPVVAPGAEQRASLRSWPGATGALSAGFVIMQLVDSDPEGTYAGAAAVVLLSVAGHRLVEGPAFVLTGLAGSAAAFAQGVGDAIGTGDGGDTFLAAGLAVACFVTLATAIGWALPATRVVSGVAVGTAGLVVMTGLLYAVLYAGAFYGASVEGDYDGTGDDPYDSSLELTYDNPFVDDTYVLLGCCAALVVVWSVAALVSGHVGFRLLVLAQCVLAVPLGAYAVRADHPTWWGVVVGTVGAIALGAVVLWLRRPRPERPVPYGPPDPADPPVTTVT